MRGAALPPCSPCNMATPTRRFRFRFNDVPLVYDEKIYEKLKSANIDHQMAQHVAHLFIRDTVSLFNEKVHQDDTVEMDHFEVRARFRIS